MTPTTNDGPERPASGGFLVRCPSCRKGYRIHPERLPAGLDSFNCRRCGAVIALGGTDAVPARDGTDRPVLVVLQEDELAQLVLRVLGRGSMAGNVAATGQRALTLAAGQVHAAALVSVVLPDMMGYELIDRLKMELEAPVPTILLSTIHHAARYKRAPTSLYGADDHIERHHLPDMLLPKILRLVGRTTGAPAPEPAAQPPARDEEVKEHREIERIHRVEAEGVSGPVDAAVVRMCRVIAADIALYNGNLIAGAPADHVMAALEKDLREGVRLLQSRFPSFSGDPSRLLGEEMARVIASRGVSASHGGRNEP